MRLHMRLISCASRSIGCWNDHCHEALVCVICSYFSFKYLYAVRYVDMYMLDMYWMSMSRGKLCSLLCKVGGCLLIISTVYPGLKQSASLSQAWLGSQCGLLLCRWYCHAWLVNPYLGNHELYVQNSLFYSLQLGIKLFLYCILLIIWGFSDCLKAKQY